VDGLVGLRVREDEDHALNLAPPAKADDIPAVATGVRTRCGFKSGVISELIHQCLRIRYCPPVSNVWEITQRQRSLVPNTTLHHACQFRRLTGKCGSR
jgi:hypothetical protein